jgi:tetratricopeptide (TPR) repeat protein
VKSFKFLNLKARIPEFTLGFLAFCLLWISATNLPATYNTKRALIQPPQYLEKFSFGYSEAIADTLWIRAIQDFDYCENQIEKNVCVNNSWLYHMLDTVTNLSPHFRIAYAAGGLALTIIITDVDGATKIFEKGVRNFPKDWPIIYRAAYHYIYEVGNKERAAELLIQAGKNGAPPWVFALAGRLYSDNGQIELAEKLLEEMISEKQDDLVVNRLKEKIASIKEKQQTKSRK